MKQSNIARVIASVAIVALLTMGCKYDTSISNPAAYVQLYMPQAVKNPVHYTFTVSDTNQVIIYGAAYGGVGYPDKNIPVSFTADTTMTEAYNIQNGTSYLSMPAGSFKLAAPQAVIPKGKLSTDPLQLTITTEGYLQPTESYLLPVRLSAEKGDSTVSQSLDVTYFVITAKVG
jgi:hypothetical protein